MSCMPDETTRPMALHRPLNLYRGLTILILVVALLTVAACDFRLDSEALLARAQSAVEQNDYRTAIIDLKTVLQREPENKDARLALGQVYLQVAEPYAAEKELRKAIELGVPKSSVVVFLGDALLAQKIYDMVLAEIDVEDAANDDDRISLQLIRAEAHLALGRPDSARQLYVEVLEKDPENPAAYLGMASTYMLERQSQQAAVSIDRAIEVGPDYAPAWLARATFRLNARLPDAAKADFERVIELAAAGEDRNTLPTALAGLTDIHLLQGNIQAARRSAAELGSIAENSLMARYTAARVAVAEDDLETAVVLLQGVLKDAPDFRQAHLLYGTVSRAKGNLAQAEMYLASAVRAWPENAEARKLLADVRLRQHKLRGASDAIEPLLNNEEPVDDHLLATAGIVKLQSGELSEGLQLFQRSVAADPENLNRKLDLAAIYLAVGEVNKASDILDSLQGTEADRARLDLLNVVALQRGGDSAGAIGLAERLLLRYPDNIQLTAVLGSLRLGIGDLPAARGSFERVLKLDAENLEALLGLGRIDIANKRYTDARQRFRRVLQISPANITATSEMARLAALEGDLATSVSWLEKARQSGADASLPRIKLATHYLSQQRYDEAMQVAQEAVQIDDQDARARNLLGVTLMARGDFKLAARNFAEAIRLGPDVAAYRYNSARAELEMGNDQAALRTAEEAFDAHPEHAALAALLADYHSRNGNFAAAKAIADRLQSARPGKAAGLVLRGDILSAQGEFAAAVEMYDQALALDPSQDLAVRAYHLRKKASNPEPYGPLLDYVQANPSDPAARMILAETYHANKDVDAASAQYDQLLKTNPENVVALNNLAWILFDRGSPRALDLAEKAYRILPDNAAIADTYGWILLKQKKSELASSVLRKAAEAMPSDPEILYHFAVAVLEFGDKEEARAMLESIVASDHEFASRSAAEQLAREIQGN